VDVAVDVDIAINSDVDIAVLGVGILGVGAFVGMRTRTSVLGVKALAKPKLRSKLQPNPAGKRRTVRRNAGVIVDAIVDFIVGNKNEIPLLMP